MVCEETKKELLEKRNVTGVGNGTKKKDGQETGEECVTVLVREKVDVQQLDGEDVIPGEVDGEKTDVVEVGELEIMPLREPYDVEAESIDTKSKERPFPQGKSIGHPDITAGTAGFLAYRADYRTVAGQEILVPKLIGVTNNHVAANENEAEPGDSVLQPGPYDGGKHTDEFRVGGLHSYVPLEDDGNVVDKAVYDVEDGSANGYVPRCGVPKSIDGVSTGDTVKKFGRTTGYREGTVQVTGARVRVRYSSGVKEFDDQVITTAMSSPGDSGSAVFKEDSLVGLLFAGSDSVTIFSPVDYVLNEGETLYLSAEKVLENE